MTLLVERRFVFEMLVNGKIDVPEAEGLMDALEDSLFPENDQKVKFELDGAYLQTLAARIDEPSLIKNFK